MHNTSQIQRMLNDELECFKEIHASSKLIADDLNEATNDVLVNLLVEREKRIKTIQLIENERKTLPDFLPLMLMPTPIITQSQR